MRQEKYDAINILRNIRNTKGFLKTGQVAQAISETGQHKSEVTVRIRHFAQKGYLLACGRDKDDARKSLLFDDGAILTAKILSIVTDTGIADKNVYYAVVSRLRSWRESESDLSTIENEVLRAISSKEVMPAPCIRFLVDHNNNPQSPTGWMFRIHWQRNQTSGKTIVECTLQNSATGEKTELLNTADHSPVCDLSIPIDNFLPELVANIRQIRKET